MPRAEAVQYAFGFAIPLLLLTHITYTRIAHEVFDVQDEMGYLMYLIWGTASAWTQTILLLIVWTHGCIGLHLWLRGRAWWRRNTHLLTGMAVLVPAFALAGFVTESRRLQLVAQDEDTRLDMLDAYNFPGPKEFDGLIRIDATLYWGFVAVLASALAIHFVLRLNARRTSVRISYTNGPTITAARGGRSAQPESCRSSPRCAACLSDPARTADDRAPRLCRRHPDMARVRIARTGTAAGHSVSRHARLYRAHGGATAL